MFINRREKFEDYCLYGYAIYELLDMSSASGVDGLRWWQTLDYSLSDRSPLTVSIEAFLRVVITKHDKQCKLLTCQLSCLPDSRAKLTAMCITLWKGSSYKWLFFVIHSSTSLISNTSYTSLLQITKYTTDQLYTLLLL